MPKIPIALIAPLEDISSAFAKFYLHVTEAYTVLNKGNMVGSEELKRNRKRHAELAKAVCMRMKKMEQDLYP